MRIRYNPPRWARRFGPVRLNFRGGRFTSWGLHLLRGLVTWNSRRPRDIRIDTPGPGSSTFTLGGEK